MVGKVSLLLVMGFSLIFLVFGHNFNSVSNRSVDNFVDYYNGANSHNLARSGANMAANNLFFDMNWTQGYSDVHLNGGTIDVAIQVLDAGQNIRKITSTGTYNGETSTVEVILSPTRFSRFAYYSVDEGSNIWWTDKDTVFGPFHTEDDLRADNHPVFGVEGYSTTIRGHLVYKDNKQSDKPEFHGTFQDGYPDTLTTNGIQPLREAAADSGLELKQTHTTVNKTVQTWISGHYERINGRLVYVAGHYENTTVYVTSIDTVYLTFMNDSINVKKGYNGADTTYKTKEAAPNGVIYAQGMNMRVKGTVEGQFSIVSDGFIYLDDDIVYKHNPQTDLNSTDLLGIVAQDSVMITNNDDTRNIKIDAAIYCQEGGFGAADYKTRSVDGDIHLLGGITQHTRKAVGTYSTDHSGHTSISSGFNKRYRYDTRLSKMFPPYFPTGGGFSIISWKE